MEAGGGLGLLFAAQFLINQEGFAALAIATLVILGTLAAARPDEARRRAGLVLRGGLVATGVAGVLLAGPLAVEFFGAQRLYEVLRPGNTYVSDLADLVVASPVATEWPPGGHHAREWGSGLLTLRDGDVRGTDPARVHRVRRWRHRRDLVVQVSAAVALVIAVLSLVRLHVAGEDLGLPAAVVALPAAAAVESLLPVRLTLYMYVGLRVLRSACGPRSAPEAVRARRHDHVRHCRLAHVGTAARL